MYFFQAIWICLTWVKCGNKTPQLASLVYRCFQLLASLYISTRPLLQGMLIGAGDGWLQERFHGHGTMAAGVTVKQPLTFLLASNSWASKWTFEGLNKKMDQIGWLSQKLVLKNCLGLGGGFKHFLMFIPIWGKDSQFDDHIFQMGWFNHQPGCVSPTNFSAKTSSGAGPGDNSMLVWERFLGISGGSPMGLKQPTNRDLFFLRSPPFQGWAMKKTWLGQGYMGDYTIHLHLYRDVRNHCKNPTLTVWHHPQIAHVGLGILLGW